MALRYGKAKRDLTIKSCNTVFKVKEREILFEYQPFVLCTERSIEDKKKKNGSDMVDRSNSEEGAQQLCDSCVGVCHKQSGIAMTKPTKSRNTRSVSLHHIHAKLFYYFKTVLFFIRYVSSILVLCHADLPPTRSMTSFGLGHTSVHC